MSRHELIHRVAALVGPSVHVVSADDGWPGFVDIVTPEGPLMRAALHVAPIGLSHRGRDSVERRFQNPGQSRPLSSQAGAVTLLIGLWEEGPHPVLVGMEVTPHRLTAATRQSYFIPLHALQQVEVTGWDEQPSSSGEQIFAFHPQMLPVYAQMLAVNIRLSAEHISPIVQASGMQDDLAEPMAAERARRAVSALVRSAAFSRDVITAYEGFCAMCGLDLGLIQGAHIYPAAAPSSPDHVWNGLALCGNHHTAFDKHLIFINPESKGISLHADILNHASINKTCELFVGMTLPRLRAPKTEHDFPRVEMFERRYEYYEDRYRWATQG